MLNKCEYQFIIAAIFLSIMFSGATWAITIDGLTNKCQSNEKYIQDISLEYEGYVIPPYTIEESKQRMGGIPVLLDKDGVMKGKLRASRFLDPNGHNRWRYVFEDASTIVMDGEKSWDSTVKYSYDGKVYKKLTVGESAFTSGLVTSSELESLFPLGTPIGLSVFRLESDPENLPLSIVLKQNEEENRIRLLDTVNKENDFNVIRIDLLSKLNNLPYIHIYFSVDHNYTPVKYEFVKNAKTGEIAYTVEVQSLEQIGDGIWFPTSGMISAPDRKFVNAFQVMGKITVNQGLEEKDFDIEFPVGTKVEDQINKREYTVTEESK